LTTRFYCDKIVFGDIREKDGCGALELVVAN